MYRCGKIRQDDRCRDLCRRGFTLIEIIIAVAIVAILAGAITPMVFRELVEAREEATLGELEAIKTGLLEFYMDTGRFPTEAEGLAALVSDPAVDGWQGPYVGADQGNPVTEVAEDSFGDSYIYDLDPTTDPAGVADIIVISGGSDHVVTTGSVGGTWDLDDTGDDLLVLVSRGPVDRDKIEDCEQELQAIADAAARYYEDNAEFPDDLADLRDDYLNPGVGDDAFTDPWYTSYQIDEDTSGDTPVLELASYGPDRGDDSGGGDDITLGVSSVPPGRKITVYRLGVAQAGLDADPGLVLGEFWPAIRFNLDLAEALDNDGWGRNFEINGESRIVFSAGPDGDPDTTEDNLPSGIGSGEGEDPGPGPGGPG